MDHLQFVSEQDRLINFTLFKEIRFIVWKRGEDYHEHSMYYIHKKDDWKLISVGCYRKDINQQKIIWTAKKKEEKRGKNRKKEEKRGKCP